jgi:hypothetical protein
MQISTFFKDIQFYTHELNIVQRILFSFVVLYGGFTLSFVLFSILSTFRRINISKALENANIYLISLILLIISAALSHFYPHKEIVLVCFNTIIVFILLLSAAGKQYNIMRARFNDALESLSSLGKIDSNILWFSYIRKNYFRFVKEYHLYLWIVLLALELITDEPYGIGSLIKSVTLLWNDAAVWGIVISLAIFFIVLHLLVIWISEKQSVGQEN